MSSINPVGSSSSNAISQYQAYLEKLKVIKATAEQSQDSAKSAAVEKSDLQTDSDHDGD